MTFTDTRDIEAAAIEAARRSANQIESNVVQDRVTFAAVGAVLDVVRPYLSIPVEPAPLDMRLRSRLQRALAAFRQSQP